MGWSIGTSYAGYKGPGGGGACLYCLFPKHDTVHGGCDESSCRTGHSDFVGKKLLHHEFEDPNEDSGMEGVTWILPN